MASDPENPEWTEADFAAAKGPEHLPPEVLAAFPNTKRPPGRPAGSTTTRKESVTVRLDTEALDVLRADGPGWHTRINEAVRKAAGL